MSRIILHCVRERTKLRIRVFGFVDIEGKVKTNVFDSSLNCSFPRNIRVEGFFYEIGPDDLDLIRTSGKSFYKLRDKDIDIKVVPNPNDERYLWLSEADEADESEADESEADEADDFDHDHMHNRNIVIRFFYSCCTRIQRFFYLNRIKIN